MKKKIAYVGGKDEGTIMDYNIDQNRATFQGNSSLVTGRHLSSEAAFPFQCIRIFSFRKFMSKISHRFGVKVGIRIN